MTDKEIIQTIAERLRALGFGTSAEAVRADLERSMTYALRTVLDKYKRFASAEGETAAADLRVVSVVREGTEAVIVVSIGTMRALTVRYSE